MTDDVWLGEDLKNQEVGAGDVRVKQNFCEVPNLSEPSNRGSLTEGHYNVCGGRTGKSRAALIPVWGFSPRWGSDVGVDDGFERVVDDKYLNKEG